MNPFEPYLPTYREGTIPERPWWRSVPTYGGGEVVRTDGRVAWSWCSEGPPGDGALFRVMDDFDLAHPLPVPRVLAGQVWARAVAGGGWESFTVGYACDDDVIIIGRPFTQPRFERWSDLQNASLRDSVLVYGPLAPWAPPGWKP